MVLARRRWPCHALLMHPSAAALRPEDIACLHDALQALPTPPATSDARAFVAAARSALDLGRADDAVALGKAALAIAPNNAQAWVVVGDACWSVHDAVGARAAWQEALSLDDKDHATAVSCARAQLMTGSPSSARALLTFVITRTASGTVRDTAAALLDSIDTSLDAGVRQ